MLRSFSSFSVCLLSARSRLFPVCSSARFRFFPFLFPLISLFRFIFSRFLLLCLLRCHVCVTSSFNSSEIRSLYCRCCLFPFAHSIDGQDICAFPTCTKIVRIKVTNFSDKHHGFLCDECKQGKRTYRRK